MNFTNREKELLLGNAPVLSRITLYDEDSEVLQVFEEDDYLIDWEYEDYRYVPNQGFIGQLVERLLDGHLKNIPGNISLENNILTLEIAVVDPLLQTQNYHSYGKFMITKIEKEDTSGSYKFQASDLTKQCNVQFDTEGTQYPCLAIELLNDAVNKANLSLAGDDSCFAYAVPKTGLEAGNYCFSTYIEDTLTYFNFTTSIDLSFRDSLMLVFSKGKVIQRTIGNDYTPTDVELNYTASTTQVGTLLSEEPMRYIDFANNNFVIENNQFTENNSCRDVICAIAKLGYTWARVGVDDRVHLDFTKKSTNSVTTYDIIDTDKYYEATKTGDTILPINKVLIGMSDVNGENIYATDTGYTPETESTIYIYDNPLTYTEELRRIAINGCDRLFGITYTPMNIDSIGHPWLEGDELTKVINLENETLYFYPFDRKLIYKGYLVTTLSSQVENKVSQTYENKNTLLNRLTHTEISVDKANQQITLVSEQTDSNSQNISNMQVNINGINQTVEHIENTEITGLQTQISSVSQLVNAITNIFQITGGINNIRNSAFLLTDDVWAFTNNGSNPYHTNLGDAYNTSLAGSTVSVAEIKFRDIKIKSKSENITNLKTDGTNYVFSFYHKQDANMTTTIKMYSTEDNTVKAFNDIVITGQQAFRNYNVSFVPTYTNYTLEIISTSTASVGYSYLYDMIINSGDLQPWQPASDEIYSTTLQMSRLGLKVYSVGDGTITLLGSDGLVSYETTDGKTLGRLVSSRTVDGDRTRNITTQGIYLTTDITNENDDNKWVETVINVGGSKYKVEYVESGV